MNRKMLINATHPEEHRVAIVEDGNLVELDIEITGKEQTRGNIYKGVVVRVETGLQAAFVDFGSERPGFLQIGEIHPSFFKSGESKGRPRINDLLRRGQELLVQVVKEERGTKGAALTTYLSLPGRFMVLMPESDTKGVSRKIEQESQRKKLKEAMASLELPDNIGYIVRTAGIGQKKTELKRDVDYLIRVYEKILDLAKKVKAPVLVYKESNLVIRSIRDYFSSDVDEVLVDDPGVAREAKEFFEIVMPEYARLVKLHQERRPIFARYQIEEQIESIARNKVSLPSGGSIVIDSTEALVAVDVNSGKLATEQGVEATAFKSNMEAAEEVARQLRLRDLGGLIVIDFIDMRDRKHIREVEKCLKDALKIDKARVTVGRISQFGLLEMSRQRIKSALAAAAYLPCPHCEGSGKVKSAESQALDFLRRVYTGMAKGHIGQVDAQIPLDVASYLLNQKRAELLELERHYGAVILIKGRPDFIAGQMEIDFTKREKEHQVTTQQYIDAAVGRSEIPQQAEAETAEQEQAGKPAEAVEAASAPAAAAPAAEAREDSVRKRRRSRRRRKPGSEDIEKAAVEEARPSAASSAPAATGTVPLSGDETLELLRSGRSGHPPTEAKPVEAAAPPAAPTPQETPTEAAVASETEKPHRKPRRRRKPAGAPKQTDSPAVGAASAAATSTPDDLANRPAPEPKEHPAAAEVKEEQVKPQRKPRRRGKAASRKTEEKEPAASPQSIPPSGEQAASATSEPRPAEGTTAAPSVAPGEPAPAPKPARPRRPRRNARSETAKSETAGATTGEGSHPDVDKTKTAGEKPARRSRPRKPAAAKSGEAPAENTTENKAES